ncbi:MAG: CDP-glycerol glycerophosphotransferase family protein [Treponema sp.]|nr:CDP-glycerol glycerophosphotransferase family protein [Treponema sp.]
MKNRIKKEITFIATDKVETQCCEPIAIEAEKRGYAVKFTDNKFEKCEIGFYCSHWNFPKHSKFSVVHLHDLGQQHGHWPIMWKHEYWNIFDIGLLPSKEWADMWKNASCYKFVKPRKGAFFTGWTKSDRIYEKSFEENCEKIINEYGIDKSKKTILYAPSWEWGGRQLEICEAVKNLPFNLIIKQFPATSTVFPEQYKIINEMHELTRKNNYSNVFILDSSINIYDAINISDVLVSEESSTLYEAMLLDKPVIAVTDWMVPDVTPPRFPDFPYDFAIKIKKQDLSKTLEIVLQDDKYLNKIIEYRKVNFPNLGYAAKNVMDIIDCVVEGINFSNVNTKVYELSRKKVPKILKNCVFKKKWRLFKEEFAHNTLLGGILYKFYEKLKWLNQ